MTAVLSLELCSCLINEDLDLAPVNVMISNEGRPILETGGLCLWRSQRLLSCLISKNTQSASVRSCLWLELHI